MFGWKTKARAPHHRAMEMSGAFDGAAVFSGHGLIAGTTVACAMGWRPVEAITAGDKVLTFDHGMQTVVEVRRTVLWLDADSLPQHLLPVVAPAGALGNKTELRLLPEQGIMVESDAAADTYGDPFAVVPAASLAGYRGIHRDLTPREVEVVTLFFTAPQVIYTDGGTLTYCPQAHLALSDMINPNAQAYDVLNTEEAAFLVDCMQYEQTQQGSAVANVEAAHNIPA